jgi:hypothetical protein
MRTIDDPEMLELLTALGRPALHSYRLRLNHPAGEHPMEFTAPLDSAMQKIFDALGATYE